MSKTNIIVSGAHGRMGQAIIRLCAADAELAIIGGLESSRALQHERREVLPAAMASDLRQFSPPKGAVIIEFSAPEPTLEHVEQAEEMGLGMVIGTTGISGDDMEAIRRAATKVPIVMSSNMSVGVNLLQLLVAKVAETLPEYDIEIVEMHHRHKKDAPSGTAVMLGEAAAAGRKCKLGDVACFGRQGMTGDREPNQIGIHAVRGGDIVGDHLVTFAGEGERIELVHRATSRDTFAMGAIRAAKFAASKPHGLFTMRDVLGI